MHVTSVGRWVRQDSKGSFPEIPSTFSASLQYATEALGEWRMNIRIVTLAASKTLYPSAEQDA